jgi:hypothetical protein
VGVHGHELFLRSIDMKLRFAVAVLVVFACRAGASQDQPEATFKLRLSTTVPEGKLKSGAKAPVQLTITNVSSRLLYFSSVFPMDNPDGKASTLVGEIHVRDAKGRAVALSEAGKKRRTVPAARAGAEGPETVGRPLTIPKSVSAALEPGQSVTVEIDLNDEFVLTPGSYTVRASRPDPGSGRVIDSNELQLTIVR